MNTSVHAPTTAQICVDLQKLIDAHLTGQSLNIALIHYVCYLSTGRATHRMGSDNIAKQLGLHRNTIAKSYAQLCESGLIERVQPGIKQRAVTTLSFLDARRQHPCEMPTVPTHIEEAKSSPAAHATTIPQAPPKPASSATHHQEAHSQHGTEAPPKPAMTLKQATALIESVRQSWSAEWHRMYAMCMAYGLTRLPADDAAALEQFKTAVDNQTWRAFLITIQPPKNEPSPTKKAASKPLQEGEQNLDSREQLVMAELLPLVKTGNLKPAQAIELLWSVCRGELADITQVNPLRLGLRLIGQGRWTTPRSFPQTWTQRASHFERAQCAH